APAVIDDDIFQVVVGGKVDEYLISRGVHAGFEVYASQVASVPPVPSHFAGFNPGNVFDAAGGGKTLCHVVVGKLRVLFGDEHHTPGELLLGTTGDVVCTFCRYQVQPVVSADYFLQRIGGKCCLQSLTCLGICSEEHAGIVFQSGFHDNGFLSSVQANHQWGDGE